MEKTPEQNMQAMLKKIVSKIGDATPKGINLYYASRLEFLTKILIGLTIVLFILAVIQIILLVSVKLS